jgi:3-keto-disaccharide hydrolase
MRLRLGIASAVVAVTQFAAAQDQPWHSLFDGSTSKGWVEVTGKPFPTHSWAVEDGCLKALVRTDGFEDIRTVETYRSFELQFEWKLAKLGNSGVKYLIQRVDDWTNKEGRQVRARGLEYQLVDLDSPDASDPKRITGALYSLLAPANANWRIAVFNESRLIVHGDHVEHWLNGTRVLSYDTTNPAIQSALRQMLPKDSGPQTPLVRESSISLQNHSSEVWFRNIKIRVLP